MKTSNTWLFALSGHLNYQTNLPHHVPSPIARGEHLCLSPGTPSLVPSQTNAELQGDPLPSQLFASSFALLNGKTGESLYSVVSCSSHRPFWSLKSSPIVRSSRNPSRNAPCPGSTARWLLHAMLLRAVAGGRRSWVSWGDPGMMCKQFCSFRMWHLFKYRIGMGIDNWFLPRCWGYHLTLLRLLQLSQYFLWDLHQINSDRFGSWIWTSFCISLHLWNTDSFKRSTASQTPGGTFPELRKPSNLLHLWMPPPAPKFPGGMRSEAMRFLVH